MSTSPASNSGPFLTAYAFKDQSDQSHKSENSLTRVSAYFNIGQKAAIVELQNDHSNELTFVGWERLPQSPFMVALKVISYCTVIIPLIMLIIYAIVRSHYTVSSQSSPVTDAKSSGSGYEDVGRQDVESSSASQASKSTSGGAGMAKRNGDQNYQDFLDHNNITPDDPYKNLFEGKKKEFEDSLQDINDDQKEKFMKGYDALLSILQKSLNAGWGPSTFVVAWGRFNVQNSYPICNPELIKSMRQICVKKFFDEEDSENCNLYDIITDQCFLAKIKEMRLIHDFEITNERGMGQYIDIFC